MAQNPDNNKPHSRPGRRVPGPVALLAGPLLLSLALLSPQFLPLGSDLALAQNGRSAGPADYSAVEASQLLNRYCLACHNDALATAGLSLQGLDLSAPGRQAPILEKVVKKLQARMMPPANMPRPADAEYEAMTHWLQNELDRAWIASPNPGRVTPLHRMNRYEYNNTVNDLLGLDVEIADLLPGDPTADGSFDNIAAALPFSPSHMDRYMSVARQLTRLATGLPPEGPSVSSYDIPLYMSQDWRQNELMPFGSRGGVGIEHHFPVAAEYRFTVQLETNYQDYVKGLGWAQELEIRLDGRLLRRFRIGGEAPGTPAPLSFTGTGEPGSIDWEEYMLREAAAGLEVSAFVEAGSHVITAAYVRQQVDFEGIPRPRQGGRLPANDEAYLDYQKVHALHVAGPYQSLASGDASRPPLFSCYPERQSAEPDCARELLGGLARRAYRREVRADDVEQLLDFFRAGREQGGSFAAGIQFALEYLLSDPEFLIRSYDLNAQGDADGIVRLSDLELASRLSYFLWSSAPDQTLLELALQGRLREPAVYAQQVRRLLADPRGAHTLVDDFAAQWLNLRRLDEVQINTVLFPDYDVSLIEAFDLETREFINHGLRQDSSVLELLGADYSFVNERLARHYGIDDVYGSRLRRVSLPDASQRGGLLAHGSLHTVTSYPGRTSPVLRGKWLLDNLLGTPPPPPPPNVPILPDAEPGKLPASIRERLAQHREDPVCSSCHTVIDPLGFALENFDVIGAWREFDELGNPVDAGGSYPGGVEFTGFADLRDWMLARPERFAHTLAEKLMTYALGRRLDYYDQPVLRRIVREAAPGGYRWSDIVLGIATSEPFTSSLISPVSSTEAAD